MNVSKNAEINALSAATYLYTIWRFYSPVVHSDTK